jgi:hypothetical protein
LRRGWRLPIAFSSITVVRGSIQPLAAAAELKVGHFVHRIGLYAIANRHFYVTRVATEVFATNYLTATKGQDVRRTKTDNRKKSHGYTEQHITS